MKQQSIQACHYRSRPAYLASRSLISRRVIYRIQTLDLEKVERHLVPEEMITMGK